MKRISYLAVMTALVLVTGLAGPTAAVNFDNPSPVEYERYESYFARNDTGVTSDRSFHLFTDEASFSRVFHPVPGPRNSFLPDGVFESRFVFAVVKRGKFITRYLVTNVARDLDKLRIYYEATDKPTPISTQNNPLILTIDKADFDYTEIIVSESGREVYREKLTD